MMTVKNLIDYRSKENQEYMSCVDSFIRDVIIPKWQRNNQGFSVPSSLLPLEKLKSELERRGFGVSTHDDHQGHFVYISIPPQGE